MTRTRFRRPREGRQAFTLIELMVVIAIVAILIGAIFQLMRAVGNMNQKAQTTQRLERVKNAISGFYGEYGYYPPVPAYASPDPWSSDQKDDFDKDLPSAGSEGGFLVRCNRAARSQQVAFEFPPIRNLDKFINQTFEEFQVMSPNTALAGTIATTPEDDWSEIKAFKFGLLSFLLPRVEYVGFTGISGAENEMMEPHNNFYKARQWKKHNPTSEVSDTRKALEAQKVLENRTVSRWLPNLEKCVLHGRPILGVDLNEEHTDQEGFRVSEVTDEKGKVIDMVAYEENGQKYALQYSTINDGWGHELCYYSPPPYQSYRLWSSGPDGKTFPPWIKLENLSKQERAWAASWIKDDIVSTGK